MTSQNFENPAAVLGELRARLEAGLVAMGLSKTLLARRAGLGRTTVSEAFSSAADVPSAHTVDAARILQPAARSRLRRLCRIWADGGYRGHPQDWAGQHLGVMLDVVRRSDDAQGFQVLPRLWVVERSFAWFLRGA